MFYCVHFLLLLILILVSFLKAIDALHNSGGRTLKPFDRATIENDESLLAENDFTPHPEKMPVGLHRRIVER